MDLGAFSTTELDNSLENAVVVVAEREGADGHDLGNGAKVKVVGVAQTREVKQAAWNQFQCIGDEMIQTAQGLRFVGVELWVWGL